MKQQQTFIILALTIGLFAAALSAGGRVSAISQAQSPGRALPETQTDLGKAFTYQGYLEDNGSPVDDTCDFRFTLFDAATGGTQVGTTETESNVTVSNGRFSILLNNADQFGPDAFTGQRRWLEVAVSCPAGAGSYTTLSPRQRLTSTPYALSLSPGATITGAAPDGILNLSNSSGDGIDITSAANDGVYVASAGNPSSITPSVYNDGFEVGGADGNGVYVGRANRDGLHVFSAGGDGVEVKSASQDGFHVTSAGSPSLPSPPATPGPPSAGGRPRAYRFPRCPPAGW